MSLSLNWLLLDLSARADRQRARRRSRNVMRNFRKYDAFDMPETNFIKTFRLNKVLVQSLVDDIIPLMPAERRNDGLSIKDKVLITLSFFASGSYQTLVGQSKYNNVSQPTVSRAVRQVTEALNSPVLFKKYVYFPTTQHARDQIKRSFYEKYKMPGIVGCIDGTHVGIIRPSLHEERYFNRKGYHSLNVMVICDWDLNILCIDPSSPGSTHDSVVWRHHPLREYIEARYNDGETMYLLGDSGYPLRRTMMTPFLNAEDGSPEANYYNLQVSARNVVERCIGVLKSRFRCLLVARKLHYDPVTAGKMVNACVVLHNIANRNRLAVPHLPPEDLQAEMNQQIAENQLRAETSVNIENALAMNHGRGNVELHHGRMAQQALIRRLWAEHQRNNLY